MASGYKDAFDVLFGETRSQALRRLNDACRRVGGRYNIGTNKCIMPKRPSRVDAGPIDIFGRVCPTTSTPDGSHGIIIQRIDKRTGKCVRMYNDADATGGGGGD